ncbi:MAG: RNase adapter RapZ [Rhodospirillaceae bacterium]|nr:RNase adapter RapZ [Rhodospirillaceae bacterium]|tara:strand:+ start:8873 stop:9745 length:873 start_codon:yes stop_codon:yes gene_type:complete
MSEERPKQKLVLITGLSGAGRSTALKVLEDEGYEAIDNLPLPMMEPLLDDNQTAQTSALAIAVDVRSRRFDASDFLGAARRLRKRTDLDVSLVFMTSDADALQRRFTETRRRHPMTGSGSLTQGLEAERALMLPIIEDADLVIDTTFMTSAELRRHLGVSLSLDDNPRLSVLVTSFSYRMGLPRNADLVFDVRFLSNPHYVDALRDMTGRDPEVGEFIKNSTGFAEFFDRLGVLVRDLIPAYADEGKRYLTIAVGCTGGRHRSVFVAERLAALLSEGGRRVSLQHRELMT